MSEEEVLWYCNGTISYGEARLKQEPDKIIITLEGNYACTPKIKIEIAGGEVRIKNDENKEIRRIKIPPTITKTIKI